MTGTDISTLLSDMIDDDAMLKVVDTKRIRWINAGVRQVRADRTDSQYNTSVGFIPLVPITALGNTLSLADDFQQMLLNWLAWKIFSLDSADMRALKRAGEHETLYNAEAGL